MLGGSRGERKLEASRTRIEPKVAIDKMCRKGRECLHWRRDGGRRDGGRLRDAKEGKGEAFGLAKWGSEHGRHWASGRAGCRQGEQGKSEADEEAGETERRGMWEGEKSRVQERDVEGEGRYLCGARGGAVRGRESDGAPYPIRKAAVSGCSDSEFCITRRQKGSPTRL